MASRIYGIFRLENNPNSDPINAYLQLGISFAQIHHALVESGHIVLGLIVRLVGAQLALLQPAKGEDNVRAQIGGYILGHEFANLDAVLRPIGVVANDLRRAIVHFCLFALER